MDNSSKLDTMFREREDISLNNAVGRFSNDMRNETPFSYESLHNYSHDSIDENELDLKSDYSSATLLSEKAMNSSALLKNWWDVLDEQYLRHDLGWTITFIVAYMLILVVGVVGNFMVILVVARRPQMRSVTNLFIGNLAVADLFVIVFCVPATLLSNIFTPWILGSIMCKAVAYVQGFSVCASAYSLAAISMDRCKGIFRALKRPRGLSKYQALFTICLIWIVALLIFIPWVYTFNVITSNEDGLSYCVEDWTNKKHGNVHYLVANLLFCYFLPLVLISVANVRIWCHVSRRKIPQDSASANDIKKIHRRTRHGVRKMLGVVTFTFLISWLPLYILVTKLKFFKSEESESPAMDILMPLAQLLGSLNSCINPVLYAFLNSKFREMFKSLLPSWVPFVPKNTSSFTTRPYLSRLTITNGTLSVGTGTISSPSYMTYKSSGEKSTSSGKRRRFQYQNKEYNDRREVFINSFRDDLPHPKSPTIIPASVAEAAIPSVAFLVAGRKNNGDSIHTTTISAGTAATRASTVTDL